MVSKLDNPFNPGEGVMPPYLAGRDGVMGAFAQMVQRIRDGQAENMLVHGLRGVGKTVLMNTFNKMCVENNLLPINMAHFNKKRSEPAVFAQTLKDVTRVSIETFSRLEKTKRTFLATVKYTRPKSKGAPGLVYHEPSYDPDEATPYEYHLQNYLLKNWEIIERSEYAGAVLLFDEFHAVRDVPKKSWYVLTDFVGVLAEVQKEGCGYFAILSGLPTLKFCVHEARPYSERMFRLLGVGRLGPDDARKAVAEPLRDSKYRFSADLIEEVVRDTGGYPYFLQFFGREIISNAGKRRIALDDYLRIKGMIVARLDVDFYDPRFDALSCEQKRVLAAMSKVEGNTASASDIGSTAGIGKASLARHLVRLEEKGVVYRNGHGAYRFSLPLVREYLQRHGAAR